MLAIALHRPQGAADQPPLGPDGPSLHPSAAVRDCRFGPWTMVGAESSLTDCTMGAYSYCVQRVEAIHAEIGKFANIAAAVRINATNHPHWRASLHHFMYRSAGYGMGPDEAELFAWRRAQRVELGHDTWIGHGAILLPGRKVGTGAIVGAGAVVSRDVAPYTIVAGNPARLIRRRFAAAIAERLEAMAWWDWPHATLTARLADFRTLPVEAFLERYG
jgi:phosphonate metabolism protein (transferase hexapeptide repeat family)